MDLTTVARVNELRGAGSTDDSTLIARIIGDVSAEFEAFLGRGVESKARTEIFTLDPFDTQLRVSSNPITSITSIKTSIDDDFSDDDALATDEYNKIDEQGWINITLTTFFDPTWVEVQYVGGMAADTTTFIANFPDIAAAADRQVLLYFHRSAHPESRSIGLREGAIEYSGEAGLMKPVRETLDRYKRRTAR